MQKKLKCWSRLMHRRTKKDIFMLWENNGQKFYMVHILGIHGRGFLKWPRLYDCGVLTVVSCIFISLKNNYVSDFKQAEEYFNAYRIFSDKFLGNLE